MEKCPHWMLEPLEEGGFLCFDCGIRLSSQDFDDPVDDDWLIIEDDWEDDE